MYKLSLIIGLFLLSACAHSQSDELLTNPDEVSIEAKQVQNTEERKILDQQYSTWKEKSSTHYSFTWQNSCYCPEEYNSPIRVKVLNGNITHAKYVKNNQEVNMDVKQSLKTIEQVFAVIDKYIDTADKLSINYSEEYSIPLEIFIDRDFQMADEEVRITISDYRNLN